MAKTSPLRPWLNSVAAVGIALGMILIFTVAHEGGHALAVLLLGGKVTRFEVNFLMHAPSISYIGITNPLHKAIISLAGPAFPLIFIPILGWLLPKVKSVLLRVALLGTLVGLLFTTIISIVIAGAYGFGHMDLTEDIARVISYSGVNPFAVASAFLAVLVMSVLFLLRVGRAKEVFLDMKRSYVRTTSFAEPPTSIKVITILVLAAIATMAILNVLDTAPANKIPAYQIKMTKDFSGSTQVYTFRVQEPTTYDFVYWLETNAEVTLRLSNLGGAPFPYNNQAAMVMYRGSSNVQQAYFTGFTLLEGEYALDIITTGQGSITMQIGTMKPHVLQLQHLELLASIEAGTFTADNYQEPGYQLLYQQKVLPGADQLLVTTPGSKNRRQVSVFIIGDWQEIAVDYVADGERHSIVTGSFPATMGYELPAHESTGQFRVSAVDSEAELFLFIKEVR